jgi:hypothetical protein
LGFSSYTSHTGSVSSEAEANADLDCKGDTDQTEQIRNLLMDKTLRLVDRNVDIFQRALKLKVAQRQAFKSTNGASSQVSQVISKKSIPINEVVEILSLSQFDAKVAMKQADSNNIELPDKVTQQLREFIMNIAAM